MHLDSHLAPQTVPSHRSTVIDMVSPATAAGRLGIDDATLLDLVNAGRIPAYRFDGEIRFRARDLAAQRAELIAA